MHQDSQNGNAASDGSIAATGYPAFQDELIPVRDWAHLDSGQIVWTRKAGWPDTRGRIDQVTPDGAMAWIVSDGASRRLYHRSDQLELLIEDDHGSPQHPI
ncbi:hypothetical protein CGK93_11090 [Arthrobacter sp. YN]|nr:hypothetical protein CGK93_11090 [Arthrobacter sp. YN]